MNIIKTIKCGLGIGDWGMGSGGWGIGDGGLGFGDWAQPTIPNPQSPKSENEN